MGKESWYDEEKEEERGERREEKQMNKNII